MSGTRTAAHAKGRGLRSARHTEGDISPRLSQSPAPLPEPFVIPSFPFLPQIQLEHTGVQVPPQLLGFSCSGLPNLDSLPSSALAETPARDSFLPDKYFPFQGKAHPDVMEFSASPPSLLPWEGAGV